MTSSLIHRAFVDLTESEVDAVEKQALFRLFGHRKASDWNDLLGSRLVLLVSEAQSGKSYECQARRDAMWAADEAAFYVELASVAAQPWREVRSPDETDRLERWRRTESEWATIFLDSVDELKLTQRSFGTALRNVANDLHGHMSRVRVVLTSRPLPVDRELFRKTFAAPRPAAQLTGDDFAALALGERKADEEGGKPDLRCVSLLPLGPEDVRKLAAGRGVVDTKAFVDALVASSMMEFMSRPQDVIEAASAWRELGGAFGTHARQVEFDVKARLKPNPRREERALEGDRALEGAKRLALAVVLTRRLTIRHDVNHDVGDPANVLDPTVVLPEWREDDRKALLERGLFGFASYGRVRFHNRLAFEFLAAWRLSELVEAGLSRKAVLRLLSVRTAQGLDVIRPSMRDVAAWLSLRRPWVFETVRQLDPAILMNLGDPGSLTVEQRRLVLATYVDKYGKGGWRGLSVPQVQVRRFADPLLAPTVADRFHEVESSEVRQVLLDLIGQAQLRDCADIARQVVWGPEFDPYVRTDALGALVALADPELKRLAARVAEGAGPWDQRFAKSLIYYLFPGSMSVEQLVSALGWIEETRSVGAELSRNLPERIVDLDVDRLEALRSGLSPLVEDGLVFDANIYAPKNGRPHLVHLLAATCTLLLKAGALPPANAGSIVLAVELARGIRSNEAVSPDLLAAIAVASSALRRAVFEQNVALARALRPEPHRLELMLELSWRGSLTLGPRDEPWMRDLLDDEGSSPDLRTAALQALFLVFSHAAPDRWAYARELRPLVERDEELAAWLDERSKPHVPTRQERFWLLRDERRKRQRERKAAKAKASWVAFWRELKDRPEEAFGSERVPSTSWNLWRAMRQGSARGRSSGWDRRLIEEHLGKEVADRLREALLAVWRRESPPLASERSKEERGAYWERWSLALAAVAAEAEDPDWARRLTPDLAEVAVRYAVLNYPGFPAWLVPLAWAHRGVVAHLLGGELEWFLKSRAEQPGRSLILQDLEHAAPELAWLLLPPLRSWLTASGGLPVAGDDEGAAATRLEQVVVVLLKFGHQADRDTIRALASAVLATEPTEPFLRVWLPVLFSLDPEAAVTCLEELCSEAAGGRQGQAVAWFAELFGRSRHDRGVVLNGGAMTPGLLLRLLRLAYRCVPPAEDNRHDGGYSPNTRDDAETGRNAILDAVIKLSGPEGWAAKAEIAADPDFAHLRDRLHTLAVERSALEAEGPAMRPEEVVKLDARKEPGPRTPAEMFAVMTDRLDDYRDYLLGDSSPREMLEAVQEERVMRRAIADHLESRSCEAYSVAQENVTADEKETDLRLCSSSGPIEGVVELKIGDKDYSGADLRSTVLDQLVTKYLQPASRRAGYLLITRATRQKWFHPDNGAVLDFAGLIAMLRRAAADLQARWPDELYIDVAGLDLAPRLSTEREAKASKRNAAKKAVTKRAVTRNA